MNMTRKDNLISKSQHYVPKFYLKKFCQENDKIYVFSKNNKTKFRSNISNIAHENFFYKLPDTPKNSKKFKLNQSDLKQTVEEHFSIVDNRASKVFKNFMELVESYKLKIPDECNLIEISEEMKYSLSQFFVLQDLRTKEHKEITRQLYDGNLTKIAQYFIESGKCNMPESLKIEDIQAKHCKEVINLLWIRSLFNIKHIRKLSAMLLNRKWVICVNNTDKPLFTSDHPVIKHNYIKSLYKGALSDEISIPLSPKYILIMLHPSIFKNLNLKNQNCMLSELTEDNIMFYNHLQISKSYNYIFSPTDKFYMMQKFLERTPEASNPNRSRIIFN